jgi:hypothetical protein
MIEASLSRAAGLRAALAGGAVCCPFDFKATVQDAKIAAVEFVETTGPQFLSDLSQPDLENSRY